MSGWARRALILPVEASSLRAPPARLVIAKFLSTSDNGLVTTTPGKRPGRPKRQPLDAVRTIWWYWVVRERSGLSESKLEAQFDEVDRKSLGKHRSTRWNKYKFGRSSPSTELLQAVDSAYKGTRTAYEHDLWLLAASSELPPSELRQVAERLPEHLRKLILADGAPSGCAFWLRQASDWIEVVSQVGDPREAKQSVGATCCFLLLMSRLAVLRQDEDLHFHSYRGIARLLAWPGSAHLHHTVALLVAVLVRDWAATQYRSPGTRTVMDELLRTTSGPRPPWISEQMSLPLATRPNTSGLTESLSKYFWIADWLAR
jgi:hypothetical protein